MFDIPPNSVILCKMTLCCTKMWCNICLPNQASFWARDWQIRSGSAEFKLTCGKQLTGLFTKKQSRNFPVRKIQGPNTKGPQAFFTLDFSLISQNSFRPTFKFCRGEKGLNNNCETAGFTNCVSSSTTHQLKVLPPFKYSSQICDGTQVRSSSRWNPRECCPHS